MNNEHKKQNASTASIFLLHKSKQAENLVAIVYFLLLH